MFFVDNEITEKDAMDFYRRTLAIKEVIEADDDGHDERAVGPCERAQWFVADEGKGEWREEHHWFLHTPTASIFADIPAYCPTP